jgi:glutathione S-transferase
MKTRTKQKIELISLNICPFVQRSAILLNEKDIDFKIRYLSPEELKNKPEWFLKISPLGKVPVLRVDDNVIFESAIINEYLDETNPPYLHPADPLTRAQNRAWIEFSSGLLLLNYGLSVAKDKNEFNLKLDELKAKLARLEEQVKGPFFNGKDISLVDIALAPFFTRAEIFGEIYPLNLYEKLPKVNELAKKLVNRKSVKESVVPEFKDLILDSLKKSGGFLAGLIKTPALLRK